MVRAWESQGSAHLILVAADGDGLREALSFMLKIEGYAVSVVSNAQAVLALRHSSLRACVVIDDSLLTPALKVLGDLRVGGFSSPALVLAGHTSPSMEAAASALGARVVEKPLTPTLFLDAVEAAIAQ